MYASYWTLKVALIDGIVMGAGAGLSMQGAFKIVTENTVCFCYILIPLTIYRVKAF